MKKLLLISALLTITSVYIANGQEVKKEQTKMEVFASKSGDITRFVDSKLPNILLSYGVATAKIRKIIRGSEALFFYQISNGDKTASIEYSDLLEVIKAFEALKSSVNEDASTNPDYMEAKFITSDGFQLGYYIDKGKATWYMQLEEYGSGKTIFFKDESAILATLSDAKTKIEELKIK